MYCTVIHCQEFSIAIWRPTTNVAASYECYKMLIKVSERVNSK